MRYGSVCSGIECASVAWNPLGWQPQFFSEIEPFPSALLAHHYPNVPNHGDMTRFKEWPDADIDLLAGGTPCQSFSVAGLRRGLDDPRGDLMLTYLAIAARYRPRWLVWENVPGVLSSNGGRDFGAFLTGLGECGYGFAYRVLDAQHVRTRCFPFAVPQRRRRVWVVGYLGDWRRAAAVLFDGQSLRGDSPPRREAGKAASATRSRSTGGGGFKTDFGCDGGVVTIKGAAIGRKPEAGPQRGDIIADGSCYTLNCVDQHAVAFTASEQANSYAWERDHAHCFDDPRRFTGPHGGFLHGNAHPTLEATNPKHLARIGMTVRRLTPTECERLMGIPDGYTAIPYRNKPADQCPDGPRYKALGNGWATNCAEWIGERIELVEDVSDT